MRRVPASAICLAALVTLFGVTALTESVTQNPMLIPGLIAVGAVAVPVSFVALVRDLLPGATVPARAIVACFGLAGVLGTAAANLVEYETRQQPAVPHALLVGGVEEPAKLVPALLMIVFGRYRRTADGLILGVAAGMGFAAFETMGYALAALLAPSGGIAATEDVLLLRGALAPCGHGAWTGLVCAAVCWPHARRGRAAWLVAPAAFAVAVLLHGGWDAFDDVFLSIAIGASSLFLLAVWGLLARRDLREAWP